MSPETADEESLQSEDINHENQHNHKIELLKEVKGVLAFSVSPRMRVLLPVCAWSGISIAFYSGVLVSILSH